MVGEMPHKTKNYNFMLSQQNRKGGVYLYYYYYYYYLLIKDCDDCLTVVDTAVFFWYISK